MMPMRPPRCGACPPADCRTLPPIVWGFCCGCALPFDHVPITCPANMFCPPLSPLILCPDIVPRQHVMSAPVSSAVSRLQLSHLCNVPDRVPISCPAIMFCPPLSCPDIVPRQHVLSTSVSSHVSHLQLSHLCNVPDRVPISCPANLFCPPLSPLISCPDIVPRQHVLSASVSSDVSQLQLSHLFNVPDRVPISCSANMLCPPLSPLLCHDYNYLIFVMFQIVSRYRAPPTCYVHRCLLCCVTTTNIS
ncbi:hypothetical protein J6590_103038 [Homalodisca vitripennis]|nr:hypothetical protein J6590_103038 [Homalodisca vitripennis]